MMHEVEDCRFKSNTTSVLNYLLGLCLQFLNWALVAFFFIFVSSPNGLELATLQSLDMGRNWFHYTIATAHWSYIFCQLQLI